jgi:transposase-like protein
MRLRELRIERLPEHAGLMDGARDDVLISITFPRENWLRIASTNPLGRLNGEIRPSADLIGISLRQVRRSHGRGADARTVR